jgi:Uma2 family endonuclease
MNQALKVAIGPHVPLEVYLRSSEYEPDAEYVDGTVVERSMGEFDHAAWQRTVMKWFLLHEDTWNIFVLPGLRVQVKPGQFRVPDVTVIDQNHTLSIDRYITEPPVAIFEILSPEDSMVRVMAKLEEYSEMGIGQIWLINPEDGAISRYREHNLAPGEQFSVPSHEIDFALSEMKALLPKRRP